jgi:hypothetical protein
LILLNRARRNGTNKKRGCRDKPQELLNSHRILLLSFVPARNTSG